MGRVSPVETGKTRPISDQFDSGSFSVLIYALTAELTADAAPDTTPETWLPSSFPPETNAEPTSETVLVKFIPLDAAPELGFIFLQPANAQMITVSKTKNKISLLFIIRPPFFCCIIAVFGEKYKTHCILFQANPGIIYDSSKRTENFLGLH
jgi:hypothetical protein